MLKAFDQVNASEQRLAQGNNVDQNAYDSASLKRASKKRYLKDPQEEAKSRDQVLAEEQHQPKDPTQVQRLVIKWQGDIA